MSNITSAHVQMYRMGTGDCFILKFFAEDDLQFKMMIDCGTWSGDKETLSKYVRHLKEEVNNHVDVLVVTHEHKDHVHVFGACEDLFDDFSVGEVWMSWTEDDLQPKVQEWQRTYGNQKKALGKAAKKLKEVVESPGFADQFLSERSGEVMLAARKAYAAEIDNFTDLHLAPDGSGGYVGGLAGMDFVKNRLKKQKIRYFKPGEVLNKIEGLPGIRILVLGPPETWDALKKESGGKGESYDHNKILAESDAFAMALLKSDTEDSGDLMPFDDDYLAGPDNEELKDSYRLATNAWRSIDNDWLYGAGNLALRVNSITNNLSLALAIEFEDSGKVMLFPGDAEYGSWASWHKIGWNISPYNDKKPMMEDLLNRTVFYKVAHHLSNNGTAKRLGTDMMTHPDLAVMATLDYNTISSQWKTTMPNRGLLQDLILRSRGRLIVMNPAGLFYDTRNQKPLIDQIEVARRQMCQVDQDEFTSSFKEGKDSLTWEYTVNGRR